MKKIKLPDFKLDNIKKLKKQLNDIQKVANEIDDADIDTAAEIEDMFYDKCKKSGFGVEFSDTNFAEFDDGEIVIGDANKYKLTTKSSMADYDKLSYLLYRLKRIYATDDAFNFIVKTLEKEYEKKKQIDLQEGK